MTFKNLSIRAKLLLLAVISILPLLGLILFEGIENHHAALKMADDEALRVVAALASQQEQMASSVRQMLMTLAELPDIAQGNVPACEHLFRRLVEQGPFYANLSLADSTGRIIASAKPFTDYNVSDRKYFIDAVRLKAFAVGEYSISRAVGSPVFPFAFPVLDNKGEVDKVLFVALNLNAYDKVFSRSKLPPDSIMSIVDHQGRRLLYYPPHPETNPVGELLHESYWRTMNRTKDNETATYFGSDGIKRVYAYARLRLAPEDAPYIYIAVAIPEEKVLTRALDVLKRDVLYLVLVALFGTCIAWLFGEYALASRLRRLRSSALALGSGNLSARAGLEYSADDCGELARTFDFMAESLQLRALQQEKSEKALRASEERYRLLAENSHDLICELDCRDRYIYINASYFLRLGYMPKDLLGGSYLDAIHPSDRERVSQGFNRALSETEKLLVEFRMYGQNGECRWLESGATAFTTVRGEKHLVVISRDVTERKVAEERLTHQAYHDHLTGLPNRLLFLDRLGLEIRKAGGAFQECLSVVLFLDLDRFKVINDSLGHSVGDQVLKGVGQALLECVREQDTVSRLGGDEFAILLTGLPSAREAIRTVRRVQRRIGRSMTVAGHEIFISASIGIAIGLEPGLSPEDVLRNADIAMYHAKAKGGGRFKVYTPKMHEQAMRTMYMEQSLRQAVERNEFDVQYQPIVDLRTGNLHCMEALARWRRPGEAPVPPGEFIPLAEETGLILPLGRQIMEMACRQGSRWFRSLNGRGPRCLHVNLSPKQFLDTGLYQEVQRVIVEHGLPPGFLNLEITETVLMESAQSAVFILGKLKKLGVTLSLDDFGTGYSSLGSLSYFPVDTLKIDRAFVSRLGQDESAAEVVQTIISLARTLGKNVIAEGVENAAQASMLLSLGCVYAQGYYFSRPLDAGEMDALLRETVADGRPLILPVMAGRVA